MRSKERYICGQTRGGIPGKCCDTSQRDGRNKKDYYRQMVAFHGGDVAYENWVKGGRKGYGSSSK